MDNIATVALSKVIKETALKAARAGLAVGSHAVDFTVRVHGRMNVAEDTEKIPTVSIPMKETLALFIRYCGITREAAMLILERAMNDALAESSQGTGAIAEAMPIINETMDSVVAPLLARLTKTPVKGMVTTKLNITDVNLVEAM